MNVLVAISSVPDTTSKINFSNNDTSFDKSGVQFVINPLDEFSLTRAIWLQEKQGAKVTTITVGLADTEQVIRKALAIGADAAIRINAQPQNPMFVAEEIAKVAAKGSYDIIFFGKESSDYNGGIIPAMVAAKLNLPFVNACIGLEVEGSTATVVREIEGGKEVVTCSLPLVIAGQKGLVEETDLKIPNMRGIMQARTKPIEVLEPSSDNISYTKRYEKPPMRSQVKFVDKDNLEELVRLLREEAKVLS